MSIPVYKIVMVGDGGVGKTSLVRRYCENKFDESRIQTLGVDFQSHDVVVDTDTLVRLSIWDVAGQDRFSSFRDQFYTGALAIALVYDVTDPSSFFSLQHWKREVNSTVPSVPMGIVGNKADLTPIVPHDEAKGWAIQEGIPFIATSARTSENVEAMFHGLAQLAHQYKKGLDMLQRMLGNV
jgi:small GTP-binding protein